jgi:hypothetical protein
MATRVWGLSKKSANYRPGGGSSGLAVTGSSIRYLGEPTASTH